MSRSLPFKPSAITSALAIAWIAAACGHSQQVQDAFESAKSGASVGTGNSGSTGTAGGPNTDNLPAQCKTAPSQQFDAQFMEAYSVTPEVVKAVNDTIGAMNGPQKASQMLGIDVGAQPDYQDIERSPDITLSDGTIIRGYNYRDAGHGVNLDAGQPNNRKNTDDKNYATVFPAASVRAASWDMDLEKRVGLAIGDETAASLNNMLLAPCMNIIRHPYWGRTQETYSEDSYHTGRMATAFTVGLQHHVVGCAKHFAANNIELKRSTQNAIMNEQTLREIYGRHFEMVIQDGGMGCIMASYNQINGVKNTQNEHLLRDILKAPVADGGMGYQGLVLSDWWAMPGDNNTPDSSIAQSDTKDAVKAGLDIEVPWTLHYSVSTLTNPATDGSLVEDSARRVLTQKFRFKSALSTDGWSRNQKDVTSTLSVTSVSNPNHETLAEETEVKSAVLLRNGDATPVLPLTDAASKIAVLGPDREFTLFTSTVPKSCPSLEGKDPRYCNFHFATDAALGDRGSSRVNGDPAKTVGPYQGIKDAAGASRTVTSGNTPDAVADADTIVVVVGYTAGDEGEEYAISEGGDRFSLDLPAPKPGMSGMSQNDFVTKVLDRGKPTIIIINSGSIVNLPWFAHANKNQATVWAGYGGQRVGSALGQLIFGKANFSGKMPMSWPTQGEQDKLKFKDAETSTNMGYFFGYREYDRRKAAGAIDMVFPFGHGLSYTKFEYSNVVVPCVAATQDAVFNVTVDIKNTGDRDGDEIAMLFIKPPPKPDTTIGDRPIKELKSFARVSVPKGMTTTAQLPVRIRDLRRWAPNSADPKETKGKWVIDPGTYTVLIGKDADDAAAGTNMGTFTIN